MQLYNNLGVLNMVIQNRHCINNLKFHAELHLHVISIMQMYNN